VHPPNLYKTKARHEKIMTGLKINPANPALPHSFLCSTISD